MEGKEASPTNLGKISLPGNNIKILQPNLNIFKNNFGPIISIQFFSVFFEYFYVIQIT